jgi:murein DD-endopeptidase MepM/ murein hydrolase activator NlpD
MESAAEPDTSESPEMQNAPADVVAPAVTPMPSPSPTFTATPSATTTSTPTPTPTRFVPPAEPPPNTNVVRLFNKPFAGEFETWNVVDHHIPLEFQDNDTPGKELAFWGNMTPGYDSHEGYDWMMPEGTPLLAVADGQIVFAGEGQAFYCPTLGKTVTGLYVYIRHTDPRIALESHYAHLSEVEVRNGGSVRQGQRLGLSGNSGCSTGPHLHFAVYRQVGSRWTPIDPYGWSGSSPDPWASDPRGAQSAWLWNDGQAPRLFHPWDW